MTYQRGTGDFSPLLNDLVTACKIISNLVNHGTLTVVLVSAATEDVEGKPPKSLVSSQTRRFFRQNDWAGHVAGMASEEMEDVYSIPKDYPRGKQLLMFDPAVGSSNIDVNVSVGTIFSILRCPGPRRGKLGSEVFLQSGTEQACAGYAL